MERMMKLQDVLLKAMAKKITWWARLSAEPGFISESQQKHELRSPSSLCHA